MGKGKQSTKADQKSSAPGPSSSLAERLADLSQKTPWEWVIAIGVALLIFLSRAPLYGLIIVDDSFITYTYAKNLVHHGQLVFNLGERVLATTTPLYALLLSIISWSGSDLFYAAPVLNLILDGLTAFFAFRVIKEIFGQQGLVTYLVFAPLFFLQTYQMWSSAGGMETSLYVFLIVMVVYVALRELWALAGVIGALLWMTRPDGIIISACIMLYYLAAKRSFPWRGVIAFVVASLPWLIFSLVYFGSPIPTGVKAKIILGADFATPFARRFAEIYYVHYKRRSLLIFVGVLLGLAGMGVAGYDAVRTRNYRLLILVAFFILFNVAFMFTKTAHAWFWYFVPLYLPLYIYAGYCCARLVGRFKPAGILVAVWMLAVVAAIFGTYLPAEYQRLQVKSVSWDKGVRQPSIWVADNAPVNASLMCFTVGIPGYYSNRRIIDPLGIVSPELLATYPGKEKAELETIAKAKPDYVLAYLSPDLMPPDYVLIRENKMPFALVANSSTWLFQKKK